MIQQDTTKQPESFVRNVWVDHFCFYTWSKESVDQLYNVIKALWTTITREPRDYPEYSNPYYAFYFRDPDGIPLEVAFT